ncbi:C40 family peptidase [Viridibacterium curvum]|uniref:NlpC/P60 domain-containing protein n=1 Tax=Viridibacterium curvum TaxID=1101404 RepID=A0ABP9Q8R7_9RHOO
MIRKSLIILSLLALHGAALHAQEVKQDATQTQATEPSRLQRYVLGAKEVLTASKSGLENIFDEGFALLGVKYRLGGNSPEDGGIDCSGLVRKVFGDALGMNLPRTAAEMAKVGDRINKEELKPGDLVFFNTMRRAFSHVGIYLGEDKFLHSPSKGGVVRVERMDNSYWTKRFNGGRRLISEAQAAEASAVAEPPVPASDPQKRSATR